MSAQTRRPPVTSGVCNRIDWVVVRVHDPRFRRHLLRDLVSVVGGGHAGADIQELPDPLLPGQVLHGPQEERLSARAERTSSGTKDRTWSPTSQSTW
jgi:hypothetical protein